MADKLYLDSFRECRPSSEPLATLLLAHGAGAGMDSPFLQQLAEELARRGAGLLIDTLRDLKNHRHVPQAERDVAQHGLGAGAEQHVHLPSAERGEAGRGRQRGEAHLAGIVEDGDGQSAAEVHVHALPDAAAVRQAEAGDAGADAADQLAARLDRLQRLLALGR